MSWRQKSGRSSQASTELRSQVVVSRSSRKQSQARWPFGWTTQAGASFQRRLQTPPPMARIGVRLARSLCRARAPPARCRSPAMADAGTSVASPERRAHGRRSPVGLQPCWRWEDWRQRARAKIDNQPYGMRSLSGVLNPETDRARGWYRLARDWSTTGRLERQPTPRSFARILSPAPEDRPTNALCW